MHVSQDSLIIKHFTRFHVSLKKSKNFYFNFQISFLKSSPNRKKKRKKNRIKFSIKTKRNIPQIGETFEYPLESVPSLLKKKEKEREREKKEGDEKEGRECEKESRLFYARIHGRPTMTVPENSPGRFVALNT